MKTKDLIAMYVAPGNDVRAGYVSEFLGALDPRKPHKVSDRVFVGAFRSCARTGPATSRYRSIALGARRKRFASQARPDSFPRNAAAKTEVCPNPPKVFRNTGQI